MYITFFKTRFKISGRGKGIWFALVSYQGGFVNEILKQFETTMLVIEERGSLTGHLNR